MKRPTLAVCGTSLRTLKAIPILGLILVLALVLVVVVLNTTMPLLVSAATAGPNNAGTGTNVDGPGTIDWTDPGNITTVGAPYATAVLTARAASEYLQGTDYGFGIPASATIDGITVSIRRMDSPGNGARDVELYLLKAGAIVGSSRARSANWPTSMAVATYGGPADLWGTTWTPADINDAGFGVSLSAYNKHPTNAATATVDYMQITVTYTSPTTLTVSPGSGTYGGTCNLTATLTETFGGAPVVGKTIDFTLNGGGVGSATTNGSGIANIPAASLAGINAGSYPSGVGASFAGDSGHGSSNDTNSLTVTKAPLTITAVTNTKVYDGDTSALGIPTVLGLMPGDNVTGLVETYDTRNVGTGKTLTVVAYTVEDGNSGNNYSVSLVPDTTGVITQAALTITGITGIDKVYDGTTTAAVDGSGAILNGVVPGDTVGVDPSSAAANFDNKNVGVGKTVTVTGIILTGADSGNYYLIDPTTTADITPLAIEVTADDQSKVYGDPDPALTWTVTGGGLVGGDSLTGALDRDPGENVGFYDITQGTLAIDDGNGGANYDLTFVDGQLEITVLAIEVTADDQTKVYGDPDPALTWTVTSGGLVGGDTFTGALDRDPGENVGFYDITQGTLAIDDGNGGANYDLTFVNGQLEITVLAIEVTADDQSKVYGDPDPALTWTVTSGGLVGGDSFTGALDRDPGENVGFYDITQGTLAIDDGNGGANYDLTFVDAQLEITAKELTITGITADDKVYDGTTAATVDGSGAILNGVVPGDTVGVDPSSAAANFDNKNVGVGKMVTVTGLILTGADAGNYYLVDPTTTADISVADLTITAQTNTKTYDGDTTAAAVPTVSGLMPGDTVTGLTEMYDNRNVGTGKTLSVDTYTVNDGNGGNNYAVTLVTNTTGVINQAPLTITAVTNTKIYDGNTAAAGIPTVAGLQGSDTVTGRTETYDNRNVGTGKTLSVATYTVNDGNGGLNYTVTLVTNTTGVITQRALTITAVTNTKTYDGNTTAAGIPTVTGLQGSDTVTGRTETYNNRNVGTGKTLSVATYTVNDGNSGLNYTVTLVTNTTGVITHKALTITATGVNKVYDGTTVATVTLSDNRVAGDILTTSYASASFADKNVGTGKTVSVSGISISGADAGNYTFNTTTSTTADITARALTVTATGVNRVYDGTTVATVTLSDNRVAGDILTTIYASASFANKNVGTGKTVSVSGISISGADASNYAFNITASTTADITPKTLTITAGSLSKTYGDTVTFAGTEFTTVGLANADTVTSVTLTSAGAAASATIAGSPYSIVPSAAVGTGLGNYTISYVDGSLTVSPKPLTITANNRTKTYGATVAFAGTEFAAGGLVNADTVTGVTLTSAGAAASATVAGSPYSIVPSAAVGTGLSNYTISYVSGSLTVNKASIGLSMSSSVSASTRGHEVTFTATVTGTGATGTVTFKDGETVLGSSTLSDGTATYTTSTLSAGTHSLTAVYGGDANFAGDTSASVPLTVKTPSGVNWGLIGGIIAAVLLVGLLLFLFFGRGKKKPNQPQSTMPTGART